MGASRAHRGGDRANRGPIGFYRAVRRHRPRGWRDRAGGSSRPNGCDPPRRGSIRRHSISGGRGGPSGRSRLVTGYAGARRSDRCRSAIRRSGSDASHVRARPRRANAGPGIGPSPCANMGRRPKRDTLGRDCARRNARHARRRRGGHAIAWRVRVVHVVRTRVVGEPGDESAITHDVVVDVRVESVRARAERPVIVGGAVEQDRPAIDPDVVRRQWRPAYVRIGAGGNSEAHPRGRVTIAGDPCPAGPGNVDPTAVVVDDRTERVIAHPHPVVAGGERPMASSHVR